MLTLGFWNLYKKDNTERLAELTRRLLRQPDEKVLIGFSEGENIDDAALAVTLGAGWRVDRSFSRRFGLITNLDPKFVRLLPEQNGCLPVAVESMQGVEPITTLVWLVHLSSAMGESSPAEYHSSNAQDLQRDVVALELKEKTLRSVLIGDFNMEPYSTGMTSLRGLNAVMCRYLAGKKPRSFGGIRRRYFYNPMWNFLGDQTVTNQPASYYYVSTTGALWHAMDQILIRPEVIAQIADGPEIITDIGGKPLLSSTHRQVQKSISDHLPISIRLAI